MGPNYLSGVLDLILPRTCCSCDTALSKFENSVCDICLSTFNLASNERVDKEYFRKFLGDELISNFDSAFIFKSNSNIQKIIHSLKYNERYHIGRFLGEITADILINKITEWQPDLIIPIPLHSLKKAERGYNQSDEISIGIGNRLGYPIKNNIIKRARYTKTQTQYTLNERKQNIRNAFKLKNKSAVKNKNILLIDDVITTGATINECARILKERGAKNVYAVSCAIAD